MAIFPTTPRAALPWVTNALTLMALVCVTWWSAEQRPAGSGLPDKRLATQATLIAQPAITSNSHAELEQALLLAHAEFLVHGASWATPPMPIRSVVYLPGKLR